MKQTVPLSEYRSWQLYWQEEPWGPWRDNLHMAVLAREVISPHLRKGSRVNLLTYFYRNPSSSKEVGKQSFFQMLRAVAKPVKRSE